jgi:hypothetical protein
VDISNDGKSPPHGPCNLAGQGSRSSCNRLGRRRLGGVRKINNGVKSYSGSHLIELNLVPWTYLMDGADMSDGQRLDNLS